MHEPLDGIGDEDNILHFTYEVGYNIEPDSLPE
jgi:hypothetical protein